MLPHTKPVPSPLSTALHITPAGLPLMNKKVYDREQTVAAMRDAKYSDVGEFKDDMRSSRMSIKRGGLE